MDILTIGEVLIDLTQTGKDRAGYFGHAVCQAGRFFWQGLSWGSAECTAPGACSRLHSLSVPAVTVGF